MPHTHTTHTISLSIVCEEQAFENGVCFFFSLLFNNIFTNTTQDFVSHSWTHSKSHRSMPMKPRKSCWLCSVTKITAVPWIFEITLNWSAHFKIIKLKENKKLGRNKIKYWYHIYVLHWAIQKIDQQQKLNQIGFYFDGSQLRTTDWTGANGRPTNELVDVFLLTVCGALCMYGWSQRHVVVVGSNTRTLTSLHENEPFVCHIAMLLLFSRLMRWITMNRAEVGHHAMSWDGTWANCFGWASPCCCRYFFMCSSANATKKNNK